MSIYKSRFEEARQKFAEAGESVRTQIEKSIKEKQRRRTALSEAQFQGELKRARQGLSKRELKELRETRKNPRIKDTHREDPFATVGTANPIDFTKTGRGKIDLLRPR